MNIVRYKPTQGEDLLFKLRKDNPVILLKEVNKHGIYIYPINDGKVKCIDYTVYDIHNKKIWKADPPRDRNNYELEQAKARILLVSLDETDIGTVTMRVTKAE